jgi:three-Cys-motif partner protein
MPRDDLIQQHLEDDGLLHADVGPWAIEKYNFLFNYCQQFAIGMKNHWENRVYIDPFCGPGRAVIRGTSNRVETSPIIALRAPFTHYILRDINEENINALRQRLLREFPQKHVDIDAQDINATVDSLCKAIPRSSSTLCFCFLDPHDLQPDFSVVRKLSESARTDFLCLLAFHTDAQRAWHIYTNPSHEKVSRFLGNSEWRLRWEKSQPKNPSTFIGLLLQEYLSAMQDLGYEHNDISKAIHNKRGNPLYYLGFFSRHPLGLKFCKQADKYARDPLLPF